MKVYFFLMEDVVYLVAELSQVRGLLSEHRP